MAAADGQDIAVGAQVTKADAGGNRAATIADAEIDPAGFELRQLFFGVEHGELEFAVGHGAPSFSIGGDGEPAVGGDGRIGDLQLSELACLRPFGSVAGQLDLRQHPLELRQQHLPGGRQAHALGGADEELHVQLRLELAHLARQGRLSDVQPRRGAMKAALPGDGREILQTLQVDGASPPGTPDFATHRSSPPGACPDADCNGVTIRKRPKFDLGDVSWTSRRCFIAVYSDGRRRRILPKRRAGRHREWKRWDD
jgi:hypothetical protein